MFPIPGLRNRTLPHLSRLLNLTCSESLFSPNQVLFESVYFKHYIEEVIVHVFL